MYYKKLILLFSCSALATNIDNLVDIQQVNPNIRVDMRYAQSKNFAKQQIYSYPALFVHKDIAWRLDSIQKELEQEGLGLLIWDGWQDAREQQKMWELASQMAGDALLHVSNPSVTRCYKCCGVSVELTLVDKQGNQLAMPTDFDDLMIQAHSKYLDLSQEIITHRALLHAIMRKHGFTNFELEWWYFSLQNWRDYHPIFATNEELHMLKTMQQAQENQEQSEL